LSPVIARFQLVELEFTIRYVSRLEFDFGNYLTVTVDCDLLVTGSGSIPQTSTVKDFDNRRQSTVDSQLGMTANLIVK